MSNSAYGCEILVFLDIRKMSSNNIDVFTSFIRNSFLEILSSLCTLMREELCVTNQKMIVKILNTIDSLKKVK